MKLNEFLRDDVNARKIFGKKEIGILLKQLDGLTLTQSEKNRLSRDIRPKLKLIKDISRFEDEFELKKGANNLRIIDKAVQLILQDALKEEIIAILLFGSHASGQVTRRSDIDICIVFRKNLSLKEATEFRIRVSGQLPERVDVQVFNILPQKIKREIARIHKVLYHSKGYDNINFSLRYLKDDGYFIRMDKIFSE